MRSTASPVSRSPAVSVSSTRTPPICTASVSVSRVVPGISVTIARSPPSSAFSRLLLPAFGLPQSTTRKPSSSMRPARASQAAASFAAIALQAAVTSRAVCVSSTSSGKSIAAAIAASRDVISCPCRPHERGYAALHLPHGAAHGALTARADHPHHALGLRQINAPVHETPDR